MVVIHLKAADPAVATPQNRARFHAVLIVRPCVGYDGAHDLGGIRLEVETGTSTTASAHDTQLFDGLLPVSRYVTNRSVFEQPLRRLLPVR